jgi:hypothetical protein
MGSRRKCTRILSLEGFRVATITWDGEEPSARVRIAIDRRGIRGDACSGCHRRTWRLHDREERTWDDMPWAEHRVLSTRSQLESTTEARLWVLTMMVPRYIMGLCLIMVISRP